MLIYFKRLQIFNIRLFTEAPGLLLNVLLYFNVRLMFLLHIRYESEFFNILIGE